jgi:hypothetical protein
VGTTTRRLSGLDAAFLALETERSTGHVGGLSIIDPATAAEPLDLDRSYRSCAVGSCGCRSGSTSPTGSMTRGST